MAAATGNAPTAGEYVIHHLQHLRVGSGFWTFHLDSIFWAVLTGVLGTWFLYSVARKVHAGVPGRMQAAVEFLVEMVDSQAKGIVHNAESRKLVSPLALTVFVWVFLMNFMDLIPVDLLPELALMLGIPYQRVVPTADLSVTMGLSVSVLLICIAYNIKIKGAGGWVHELLSAPFGAKWYLAPVNLGMQLIEFVAKTVSHGMRLFGNLYAGELIFILIALMGGAWFTSVGLPLAIGHIIAGSAWAIFHILIITLQAFVFMMLTLVYIGQAHDAH